MKYTVIITIGRNVGNAPMSGSHWTSFRWNIANVLNTAGTILQRPNLSNDCGQLGLWEGKQEEAAAFVGTVDAVELLWVRSQLQRMALMYEQKTIGFIAVPGTEHLIHAE